MTITYKEDAAPPPTMISEHPAHLHPGHKLKLKRVEIKDGRRQCFTCDGCKEQGAGTRYSCERCNFDLHTCCAVAPDTVTHPLLGVFLFLHKPEPLPPTTTGAADGTNKRRSFRVCVACGEAVRGFVYHRFDDSDDVDGGVGGIDMHPCCCARLPDNHALLLNDDRVLLLQLQREELPPRPRDMSVPSSNPRHQPPPARHRHLVAGAKRQVGNDRDPPPENNTHRPDSPVVFVNHRRHQHQVASRAAATSDDGNRVPERQPPAARHRSWWKWKQSARSSGPS